MPIVIRLFILKWYFRWELVPSYFWIRKPSSSTTPASYSSLSLSESFWWSWLSSIKSLLWLLAQIPSFQAQILTSYTLQSGSLVLPSLHPLFHYTFFYWTFWVRNAFFQYHLQIDRLASLARLTRDRLACPK